MKNMDYLSQDTLLFFEQHREVYPLYEAFVNMLFERFLALVKKENCLVVQVICSISVGEVRHI